ncbi:MAG: GNAT family N-acetyltransferase [Alphaproteobacteria bacterium]|nr:GNAT family N-acetyltransferase [Alphaproteobacteria bacterium]
MRPPRDARAAGRGLGGDARMAVDVSGAPSFRDATRADIPAIVALNDSALPHVNELPPATWLRFVEGEARLRVAADGAGGIAAFTAALPPGRAYGSHNYAWFQRRMARFLYLDRIVVAAAFRRDGWGRAAYRDVFASAPDPGAPVACEVNLDPPNDPSLAFHGGLGFREVGVQVVPGSGKRVAMLARRPDGVVEPSLAGPDDGATLRRATPADAEAVAAHVAAADIAGALASGRLLALLAERAGEGIVGIAALADEASGGAGAECCILEALHVAPGLRGRGIGARLVAAARREAKARGSRRVEAAIPDGVRSPAVLAFCATNGFAPAGQRMRIELA